MRWLFEVVQEGIVVASGESCEKAAAIAEAAHYCRMYRQDGPCTAIVRQLGEPKGKAQLRKLLAESMDDFEGLKEGWSRK